MRFSKISHKYFLSLSTGFFLFFVLYFYKGYDIQQGLSFSGHGLLFRSICFGWLTFLSFSIHEFFVIKWVNITSLRGQMLWRIWEVFIGAQLTFVLFNYFWAWTEWSWSGYFLMVREYYMVMIFPLVLHYALYHRSSVQKYKPVATPVSPDQLMTFLSENGRHVFKIKPEFFLFAKAADNYIEIFYLKDGVVKSELQRGTLKLLEEQYPHHPNLLRCHRSYIVNPIAVQKMRKTGRQMSLDVGFDQEIPISKKYEFNFSEFES